MPFLSLSTAVEGPVATLTLNRPERRNALSLALMQEMIAHFEDIAERKDIHVVILAAAGRAFSSGHDLDEMIGRDLDEYRHTFDVCTKLMARIQSIPQPVIAQVQGVATAAGCQLVATCDLAVASTEARFATPGVKIGLFCTTPMVAVTRAIGRKHAMEMLLTGQFIDAGTAASWGLVNRVTTPSELEATTRSLALQIADASSDTIALGKQAFYSQIDLDQCQAYGQAKEIMALSARSSDAQEGISAFLEKREPHWTGR